MARIKGGLNAKKKHNRVLKLAKGYRGARSKQYRVAKQSVMRALTSSYAGRKQRKRQFRQLWIARINAAARMNGISYSQFMHGLKLAGVDMNRKMLAAMAVNDAEGFATLAELAKSRWTGSRFSGVFFGNLFLELFAVVPWGHLFLFMKDLRKIQAVVKTNGIRNGCDGQVGMF